MIDVNNELLEACRRNDQMAQVRIYEMFSKTLFNTCFRIVDNDADAEDLMQESFIEAFDKIHTFRGEGGFGGWLKRIAINNSINFLRKHRKWIIVDHSEMEVADPEPDNEEISENVFCRIEEIRNAINKLQPAYKLVLSLHLLEGYDHEEIAAILGTTHGNIRTRYSRAKQKLLQTILKLRN
ncbi:MAG TPA: sigma-70 family RNA polymerase sigma factor [Bacteroidales bacterium]|nr:sigma-70 family RNA polymerase sigma factor [Bacteroidales bacterium]HRW96111.1 sigma-70 family RNA polymerase sigma factor [Bacteroidales bacterium]